MKSDKLIIFGVSEEFFRSNFWLLSKDIISDFEICCVNFASFIFFELNLDFEYYFSIDSLITKVMKNKFSKTNLSFFGKDENLVREVSNLGFEFGIVNSGSACLHKFLQLKKHKEIHVIGINMVPNSGAVRSMSRIGSLKRNITGFKYVHDTASIRENRFPKNALYIQKICEEYKNEVKVYRTYDKSNLSFLPESPLFFTMNQKNINIDSVLLKYKTIPHKSQFIKL